MTAPSLQQIELLTRHTGWVRALAGRLVADPDLADDVAQDAALAALGPSGRAQRGPAWLAGIVRNVAANLRRRAARYARAEAHRAPAEAQPGAADTAALVEQQRLLANAVLALDAPFRDVVLLRFYEDLPRREIARRLQVPVATVNSRLARALHKLRAQLDREHGGDRRAWVTALAPIAWATAAATAADKWTLGALIMQKKKVVAAAVAAVLVGGGTWLGMRGSGDGNGTEPVAPRSVALGAADLDEGSAPNEPEAAAASERVALRAEPPATRARGVRVRVVDGPTGEPLPGAEVRLADVELLTSAEVRDFVRQYKLHGGDAFSLLFDLARPVPLDGESTCVVADPDSSSQLMASHSGSRGILRLRTGWANTGEPATLSLWPVRTARVQVVDRTGKPVANVPVHLHAHLRGNAFPLGLRYTAANGMVELSWFRGALGDGERIRLPEAGLAFPLVDEVVEPQAADEPRDVTLVCPEVGRVEAVVTICGEPAPDGTLVLLRQAHPERVWEDAIAAETKSGRASFWPVGLGTALVASTNIEDKWPKISATGDGPKLPRETVTLSLSIEQRLVRVSGRILASDGSPIASRQLIARILGDSREAPWARIETDGEGRFEYPFRVDAHRAGGFRVEFDGQRVAHGLADVWASDPGGTGRAEIGDVRLPAEAPLVEGIVVDERGEPLQGVTVRLVRKSESSSTGWASLDVAYKVPTTDASGRFTISRVAAAPDLYLHATTRGPLRHDPVGFTPGTRGVRLIMRKAGVLTGQLLVADGVPADRLGVEVWPESRGVPSSNPVGWTCARVERDGRLRLDGLEPDSYTVAVMLSPRREIARVEGVVVRAGTASSDPRLAPLDLSGIVRALDVRVRDEQGQPLRARVWAFAASDGRAKRTVHSLGHSDRPVMLAAADDMRALLVEHDGYFSAALDAVEDRMDVVLRRGLPVTVRVANVPPLAEPYSLRVALDPVVPRPAGPTGRQVAYYRDQSQPDQATLPPGGEVELHVREPGVYRVRVIVRYDERFVSTRDVTLDPAPEVHAAEGVSAVLPVELDPAQVQRAIAELPR